MKQHERVEKNVGLLALFMVIAVSIDWKAVTSIFVRVAYSATHR